jgi:protein SCO1/2
MMLQKKTIVSLALAILMPLTGYWLVKFYSKGAVQMPRHYFYDSVGVKTVRGKQVQDTIWHQVQDQSFTNQFGKTVKLSDLNGKIVVVNFFFTRFFI